LPKDVLDADIKQVRAVGVAFVTGQALGTDFTLRELIDEYDAVVLATGKADTAFLAGYGFECTSYGIAVDRKTFETSIQGVFAGGNIVAEGNMAVRSSAHGKTIAHSVHQYLFGLTVTAPHRGFNSMMGSLFEGEADEFLGHAASYGRSEPSDSPHAGFSRDDAERESHRCLHCDCRKPVSCKLRRYADEYGAHQRRYRYGERTKFVSVGRNGGVVFEQGKCIKCNICIDITEKAGERLGLTFVGRGFDVRVAAPFGEEIENCLEKTAAECIEACPTGALAWRNVEEEAGERCD
jgi:ferredoxin